MSIFSFVTEFFSSGKSNQGVSSGANDQLIFFLLSLITDQEQGKPLLKKYEDIKILQGTDREMGYVSLYFSFEDFLAKNKPPVVAQTLTSEELKELVNKKISTSQLPISTRLIFLKPEEKTFFLLETASLQIVESIVKNLGIQRLAPLMTTAISGTQLASITIREGSLDFSPVYANLSTMTEQQLTETFKVFYTKLLQAISTSLGPVVSSEFFYNTYETIKKNYSPDLTLLLVKTLPQGVVQTS